MKKELNVANVLNQKQNHMKENFIIVLNVNKIYVLYVKVSTKNIKILLIIRLNILNAQNIMIKILFLIV